MFQGQIGRTHYDEAALRNWTGRLSADLVQHGAQQTLRYGLFANRTFYDDRQAREADVWRYGLKASLVQERGPHPAQLHGAF